MKSRLRAIPALFIALVGFANVATKPRFASFRGVEVVNLIAVGACFAVGVLILIGLTKSRGSRGRWAGLAPLGISIAVFDTRFAGRLQEFHAVDILQLVACGACIAVALLIFFGRIGPLHDEESPARG